MILLTSFIQEHSVKAFPQLGKFICIIKFKKEFELIEVKDNSGIYRHEDEFLVIWYNQVKQGFYLIDEIFVAEYPFSQTYAKRIISFLNDSSKNSFELEMYIVFDIGFCYESDKQFKEKSDKAFEKVLKKAIAKRTEEVLKINRDIEVQAQFLRLSADVRKKHIRDYRKKISD
jgi:hypothetical protein